MAVTVLLMFVARLSGQATIEAKQMIGITPMLPYGLNIPEDAKKSLLTKLNQMTTQNGFGSTSGSFVLTANVVTLDKQATATAPVQFVVDLEVSVYVVDVTEQLVVAETSFVVKGIDRLENKAVIQAINQIKPRGTEARAFMNNTREKLIEYYNTRIPTLITKAQSLAEMNNYRGALAVLADIPEAVDQYPVVAEQMTAIYLKMIDREAQMIIQEAEAKMAIRDYEAVVDALVWVDPSSSHFGKATEMIRQVKSTIDAREQEELEEKLKKYEEDREAAQRAYDDAVMLEKMRIEAAQKVGVETAKTESSVSSKLNDWFLGKFK